MYVFGVNVSVSSTARSFTSVFVIKYIRFASLRLNSFVLVVVVIVVACSFILLLGIAAMCHCGNELCYGSIEWQPELRMASMQNKCQYMHKPKICSVIVCWWVYALGVIDRRCVRVERLSLISLFFMRFVLVEMSKTLFTGWMHEYYKLHSSRGRATTINAESLSAFPYMVILYVFYQKIQQPNAVAISFEKSRIAIEIPKHKKKSFSITFSNCTSNFKQRWHVSRIVWWNDHF